MEEEIWKELEENSNYFISNFGSYKNNLMWTKSN